MLLSQKTASRRHPPDIMVKTKLDYGIKTQKTVKGKKERDPHLVFISFQARTTGRMPVLSLYRPDKLEAVENTRSHIQASQFTHQL